MKQLLVLICAVLIVSISLCACSDMNRLTDGAKQSMTEAASDIREDASEYTNDNDGLLDDNRETIQPTNGTERDYGVTEDTTDGISTDESNMDDAVDNMMDEMIENGEIDDGDGNVGEAENRDGDGNIDPDAVDDEPHAVYDENN